MKEQLQKMLHQTILIPCLTIFGRIAQSVEQRTENPCVAGSIPVPANKFRRNFLSWKEATKRGFCLESKWSPLAGEPAFWTTKVARKDSQFRPFFLFKKIGRKESQSFGFRLEIEAATFKMVRWR